jgi:hypothetical protein
MMKTKYIIVLLLLLIAKLLFAQNKTALTYQLNGYVNYENRGSNLINADITVNGNNKTYQTNTDSNGHFCLEGLERGFYDIIISISDANKNHFDFFVYNSNVEVEFEILREYHTTFSCPSGVSKSVNISFYQQYLVKAPNQQIEALAAYQRGVDYRYSNTFNFGNTNEIFIGK